MSSPEKYFAAPFLLDKVKFKGKDLEEIEPKEPIECSLALELASMLILSEEKRSKGGGRIFKKPLESFEFLSKSLWPFWIIPLENRHIVMNALTEKSQRFLMTIIPPFEKVKELYGVSSFGDFPNALDSCITLFDNLDQEEIDLPSVVDPSWLFPLSVLFTHADFIEPEFVYELEPLIKEKDTEVLKSKFENILSTENENFEKIEKIKELTKTQSTDWMEKIDTEINALEEDYKAKIEEIKPDVELKISEIEEERKKELEEVKEWEFNRGKTIAVTIPSIFESLEASLGEIYTYAKEIRAKAIEEKITDPVKSFEEAESSLEKINEVLSKIGDILHTTSTNFEESRDRLREVQDDASAKRREVNEKYDNLVKNQHDRIESLKNELSMKKNELLNLKEEITKKSGEIMETLEGYKNRCQEEKEHILKFTLLSSIFPEELRDKLSKIYVPLYVTKFLDDKEETRFMIIPPAILPDKIEPEKHKIAGEIFGLDLVDDSFVEIKDDFEKMIVENEKIRAVFDTIEKDLLAISKVETEIYNGLEELQEKKLLKEKEFTDFKIAAIDAFRKK